MSYLQDLLDRLPPLRCEMEGPVIYTELRKIICVLFRLPTAGDAAEGNNMEFYSALCKLYKVHELIHNRTIKHTKGVSSAVEGVVPIEEHD